MFGNLQLYVYYCYFIFVGEFQIMASRQRSAFPPNFVHSLDGSHMMMTALACSKAGLNFAGLVLRFLNFAFLCFYFHILNFISGVHDSYWTHACDVDTMNKILREKFVELYEAPILENVSVFTFYSCICSFFFLLD